jgi:ribosomal protein S21
MINIQVEKNSNENNVNLLRRFTKRVQGAGILNRVRSLRYAERMPSPYTKKKRALKSIRAREEMQELIKLGKIQEKQKR